MNRLILIGNGFDLAHGMKTSYNDFILWYLKECFSEADKENVFEDEFIKITKVHNQWSNVVKDVSDLVDYFYQENNLVGVVEHKYYDIGSVRYTNQFKGEVKSTFLRSLLSKCSNLNWVDIENDFYRQLKKILLDQSKKQLEEVKILNDSLKFVIEQLKLYLESLDSPKLNEDYKRIFDSMIYQRELCIKKLEKNEKAKNTLILSFNYTNTPEKYLEDETTDFKVNYIHGTIEDSKSLIFGFGDELDEDYKKLELQKSNAFFEYIKSFWYFKNSKYHNLVRFTDGDEFQVYILGHSCGLSDRTMLNMIFEHDNCKSIKIFYHGTKEKNNYTNLTQEISRHFKDKGMMRKKIVPFDKSEPMPQVE